MTSTTSMTPIIRTQLVRIGTHLLIGVAMAATTAKADRETIRSANRPATRDIKGNREPLPRRPANVDIDNRRQVDIDADKRSSVDIDVDKRRSVNVDVDNRRAVNVDIDNRRAVNIDVDVDHRHGVYWRHSHTIVVGAVVKTVPATRVVIVVGGTNYFYADGVYYVQGPSGYVVVASPVGAVITTLPAGSISVVSGSSRYFYFNGTYYVSRDKGFVVVSPPVGVKVTLLPVGATRVVINGVVHFQHGGIHYRPSFENGVTVYTTVRL